MPSTEGHELNHQTPMREGDAFRNLHKTICLISSLGLIH
jgi:hypothetical protein